MWIDPSGYMAHDPNAKNVFSQYSVDHLTGSTDKFTKKGGLSGGHNIDEFDAYFNRQGVDYKINSANDHSLVDGLFDVNYNKGTRDMMVSRTVIIKLSPIIKPYTILIKYRMMKLSNGGKKH